MTNEESRGQHIKLMTFVMVPVISDWGFAEVCRSATQMCYHANNMPCTNEKPVILSLCYISQSGEMNSETKNTNRVGGEVVA